MKNDKSDEHLRSNAFGSETTMGYRRNNSKKMKYISYISRIIITIIKVKNGKSVKTRATHKNNSTNKSNNSQDDIQPAKVSHDKEDYRKNNRIVKDSSNSTKPGNNIKGLFGDVDSIRRSKTLGNPRIKWDKEQDVIIARQKLQQR